MSDFKKSSGFAKRSFGARPTAGGNRAGSSYSPRAFGARSSDGPVERFEATCNACKARCEVPFRPNGKKPVYCRDCFGKHQTSASISESHSASRAPGNDLASQFDMLNSKLDRVLRAIEGRSRSA